MKQTHIKIDDSLLEFLRSVDCDEMSKDLFVSHGISAVYTVENGVLVLIGSTDRALSEAQKRLNVVLQTKDVIIEDQGVLALPQWHDLFKHLQSLYNTSKKRTVLIKLSSQRDKVIVSGFREPVIEVSQTLGDFIEKHTRIEDAVLVKSHAVVEFIKERKSQNWQHLVKSNKVTVHFDSKRPRIKVSGEQMSVQPAMTFFRKMSDALYTDTLIIKKAGAKKYFKEEGQLMLSMLLKERGFVVVLQEDHMLEEENSLKGSFEDFVKICEVRMPGEVTFPLRIILCKGNIQDAKTDVIVNTVSEDLDLSKGAISKMLLQAAGHQLQKEVTTAVHASRLNYGKIVITDGYNLKCAKVFHVVCQYWKGSEHRILGQIIRDCLKKADALQMTSVSFPAIGTGVLGFPKDLVPRIILREVQEFIPQNLREITVIVHPSDIQSLDCFTRIFRHGIQSPITKRPPPHLIPKAKPFYKSTQMSGFFGKVSTPSHGVITMQVGQVTLEVSSGDITKERTDAIVNSSNHTFSLKTGVSKAILDAAGLQVERECLHIAATNKQQTEIVTSAGRLPCGYIIHIIGRNKPSEIKDVVLSVLKICEANQLSSVAFPALGTGQGGANPAVVADAMVDAVVDFVKRKKTSNVKLVKFLIFQTSMVADFKQSMLKRSGEKVEEEKDFVDKFKTWTKELLFGENSESPTNEEFVIVVDDIEPAVFQLCGETQQDLNKARDMINSLIIKEHMNIQIRDPAIGHFTREDVEMLNTMQRELTVSIKLDRRDQDPVIRLEGLTKDVHTAESRIRDMIRKVERFENRRREAFMINSLVEWKYLASGQNLKSFDMFTNYDLEKALQSKNTSVKIKIDNEEYTADLVNLQAKRGMRRIELQRVDLTDRQCALPSNWDDMKGKSVVLVNLTATSNEYADVEKEFRRTGLTSNIIQIERVQNSTLWKNYMIKKEELEAKNNHKNNEKLLFHGTAPDSTDHINHHGFNRSFAGTHGAMYGNGIYFAVDPRYSAQGYSKPDIMGHKRMYLARVLVGDFTLGKSGMLVPPLKSSLSADLYNSVTDNTNNPTMFVIFNDVQAYPEYLITFK